MKSKRIMLIGGAGFIGHNLALHLKALGADVCVVDGLAVNNVVAFSSDDVKAKNRDLYLRILLDRQRLLRDAGIPNICARCKRLPCPKQTSHKSISSSGCSIGSCFSR